MTHKLLTQKRRMKPKNPASISIHARIERGKRLT
jgi:hypothetical protein